MANTLIKQYFVLPCQTLKVYLGSMSNEYTRVNKNLSLAIVRKIYFGYIRSLLLQIIKKICLLWNKKEYTTALLSSQKSQKTAVKWRQFSLGESIKKKTKMICNVQNLLNIRLYHSLCTIPKFYTECLF